MKLYPKPASTASAAPEPSPSPAAVPPDARTDEGIAYVVLDHETIQNVSRTDVIDAHRRELHLAGKTYTHVAETAIGDWIYRHVR